MSEIGGLSEDLALAESEISQPRHWFRNSAILYAANLFSRLAGAATTVVVARGLSLHAFGIYSLSLTIYFITTVVQEFGSSNAMIRRLNAGESPELLRIVNPVIGLRLVLGMGALSLGIAAAAAAGQTLATVTLSIFAPAVVATAYLTTICTAYNAREQFAVPIRMSLLPTLVTPVLAWILIELGAGVYGVASAASATTLWNAILAFRRFQSEVGRPAAVLNSTAWSLARESLPFFVLIASNLLYARIDTFLVAKIQGVAALALYAAAVRFFDFLQLIPNVLAAAVFPASVRMMAKSERELGDTIGRMARLGLVLALPAVAGVVLLSDHVVTALLGERYVAASSALRWLAPTMLLSLVNSPITLLFYAGNRTRRLVFIPVVMLLFNLGLNIPVVKAYSYNGAAAMTLGTEALGTVLLLLLVRHERFDVDMMGVLAMPSVLLTAACAGYLEWRYIETEWILLLAWAVTYLVAVGVVAARHREDFPRIWSATSSKAGQ